MRRLLLVLAPVAFLSPTSVVAGLIDDEITLTRVSGPFIPGVPIAFPQSDSQIVRAGPEWEESQYAWQVDVSDSSISLRNLGGIAVPWYYAFEWRFGEGTDWRFQDFDSVVVNLDVEYTPGLVSNPERFEPTIIDDGHGVRLLNTGTQAHEDVSIFYYGGEYTILLEFGQAAPDPSNASFSGISDVDFLDIDLGTFAQGAAPPSQTFQIWNIASPGSADLNLDTIAPTGDSSVLTTDLAVFSGLVPASYRSFTASMDTGVLGDFGASYTLGFSDASGQSQPVLTLNLTGSVIPEPSTFAIWSLLATLGLTVGWWRRRRRAS